MYNQNGVFYNEQHSISFGGVESNEFTELFNTWSSWHLIPSSRPCITAPAFTPKIVEIPGRNGAMDLTEYLTGGPTYGLRTGSLNFIIVNHDGNTDPESVREEMANALHGQIYDMVLQDDPSYYYEGRFTVGPVEPGANFSKITLSYQLDPFKEKIDGSGSSL